jgi:flagellar L-ring protein precursor FlgH
MTTLFADLRARNVNDLVTVHVVENVVASGTADASLDKNSTANASTGRIFGVDPKFADWFDPTALARFSASTDFQGGGSTTRSGALSAVITARVTEVLPNGDLVLEGVREIEINGDRQIIVLSGVIRPADINPGNVVSSTAVGQMRIRYFGRGLMKDNLSPGWLIRIFNKVF